MKQLGEERRNQQVKLITQEEMDSLRPNPITPKQEPPLPPLPLHLCNVSILFQHQGLLLTA